MRIAVVDGQGGGIGKAIVENMRNTFGDTLDIVALGTNALAASSMLKAGANEGASGENAVAVTVRKVDMIVGSVAIIAANSMLGELTPVMAKAIAESDAKKILIPLNRCNLFVAGVQNAPLPHYIDSAIHMIQNFMDENG
jgi:NAD(P)-dependent dehydrogenase (short-subunit alcohol dehydrogenase family)